MSEELKAVEANNPGFDTGEVNARGIAVFLVATVVLLVVVIGAVTFYFNSVQEEQVYEKVLVPVSEDLRNVRAREDSELGSYRYIDRARGAVGLPIGRAMELLAKEAAEGRLPYPTVNTPVKKDPVAVVQTAAVK